LNLIVSSAKRLEFVFQKSGLGLGELIDLIFDSANAFKIRAKP